MRLMKDRVKKLVGNGTVLLSLFTGVGAVAASSCCALLRLAEGTA